MHVFCLRFSRAAAAQLDVQHHISAGIVCVSEPACPLFHPHKKTEKLPLLPALPLSLPPFYLPSASTRLWSAPAATLERWKSEEREIGEGGREEKKRWQLLNKYGASGGRNQENAILMTSSSPREEEEEEERHHTAPGLTASVYPQLTTSSHNQS